MRFPTFVKALRDEFGPLYGLVNNAGLGTEGLLATMHNSEIEALLRLNVLSPVILTKYVVRHMMADGEGRIVNISSIIASTGYNGLSVYGATKAAADWIHPLAGAGGRQGRHHRQCDCAGLHRDRIDQRPVRRAAPAHRRPQRVAEVGRSRRRRAHGGLSARRGRPQHHRQRADDRRRQYRVGQPPPRPVRRT